MEKLKKLITQKKLEEIIGDYSTEDLIKLLPFKKVLALSKLFLENEKWDSDLQEFAIKLIEKDKQFHPKEWGKSWKHEAYLGYAYGALGWDVKKEFGAYSSAAQKFDNPPVEILMHMGLLWSCPGVYKEKMDEEKAVKILEKVANETPYIEAVGGLIRLYEEINLIDNAEHWKSVRKESEEKDLYDRHSYLDFFKDY